MKQGGIIHAELACRLAALRHTDIFVISDAGLPVPSGIPVVDLGYRYGEPGFADVSSTVLAELVIEHSWVSADIVTANPATLQHLHSLGLVPEQLEHEDFKRRVAQAALVIRTGEDTMFANLMCRAGVAFG